ncbi:MAG: alpha/beta fold hydrolase [Elusimicrobiales bacterium]
MTFIILFLFFISGPFLLSGEKTILRTTDGCEISAHINIKDKTYPTLFEVHGLGSSKEEWDKFNNRLEKEKLNYVSLDLRGHGESKKCGDRTIKDYKELTKTDLINFLKDIDAVYKSISQKIPAKNIIPIGASIGANAVMEYFYKKSLKIVLMSSGINYGGFEPAELFKKTKAKILFTVSETDVYSFNSTRVFIQICEKSKKKYKLILSQNGHGVRIFDNENGDEYIKEIIDWIKN